MQRITVTEVKVQKDPNGKWVKTTIIDDKGGQFSGFDTKLQSLTNGAVIDLEAKIEGKYVNIAQWTLVEEGVPGTTTAQTSPLNPQIINRLEATFILVAKGYITAQLWIAGKLGDDSKPVTKLKDWLNVEGEQRQPQEVTTSPDEDTAWDDLDRGDDETEKEPTTVQGLLQYVITHGKQYNRTWLLKELGIDDAQLTRNPNAYYHAIKELMGW